MTATGAAGSYPGNPSLPVEVREKILMTFRHALGLFSSGQVSDCLIGCEFILKMDPRFTPARRLQEKARNRDSDVDISELQAIASGAGAPAGPAVAPAPSPPRPAPAAAPPPPPPPPRPEKPDAERLAAEAAQKLAQGDFDGAIAAAGRILAIAPGHSRALAIIEKAAGKKATRPLLEASRARAEQAIAEGRLAEARLELERIRALDPEAPAIAVLEKRLAAPGPSPARPPEVESAGAPSDLAGPEPFDEVSPHPAAFTEIASPESGAADSFSLEPPSAGEEALVPPPPPSSEMFLGPEAGGAPANYLEAPIEDEESQAAEREIARLLKQGDEVSRKGDRQQAIEVWSRVFLIDINNAEAVTRIEKARQEMAEEGRMVADLLKKGRESFEGGDREAARQFFRQAQALDPDEATARFYLDRIEQAGADAGAAAAAGPAAKPAAAPFPPEEARSVSAKVSAPPAVRKGGLRVNPRVLGLVGAFLVLTLVGVYFVFKGGRSPEPVAKVVPPESAARAGESARKGKAGEAPAEAGNRAAPAVDLAGGGSREARAEADPARLRAAGEKALGEKRYIEALKNLNLAAPAYRDDPTFAQQIGLASEKVTALTPAVKLYNEGEYETAIPILWRIVQEDRDNRDARSYLLRAYYNQGITQLQNGLYVKAAQAFQEALSLDPNDAEAARHRKFAERYQKGDLDLLGRIYVRHLSHRP